MQRCIPYQQENTSTILATAEENCWLLSDVLRYILKKNGSSNILSWPSAMEKSVPSGLLQIK